MKSGVLKIWIAVMLLGAGAAAGASEARPMLADAPGVEDIPLISHGASADVYVDSHDSTVARIAAKLLSEDIERVTGLKPAVKDDAALLGRTAVIIGTIGKSPVIDKLIDSGKLDVSHVRGRWEASVLATVQKPLANVDRALVIAGSDRRGTAFGVFEVSAQIGVSPWYWWADVTPSHRDALTIKAGAYIIDEPSVKYRGIFINDEDFGLRPWASKTFDPKFGNIGPKTYERVFELLLRLKANYLWPAMHPGTTEFGTIDENLKLADDWAIVMGASHAEPMNRNNVAWDKERQGDWRYDTNRDAVFKFWEEWARKRGPYEAVWTIGMRGIHDSPMVGPKDAKERVKLLQQAITDQRLLLAQYVNPNVEGVPQAFCPYKEALLLYRDGLQVPEDVTLVWPDDNFGYIRQLSTPEEQKRSGGSGVYYHLSYWGQPEDYLWLCTTPPSLIWEEMSKAYDNGAQKLWVVNVGDIKPAEIGMEFFLRLARNVKLWDESCQTKYLTEWAALAFGAAHAPEVAAALDEYYRLNFVARPEHLLRVQFSDNDIGERLDRFARLVARADALYAEMPPSLKDAFYETVVYPVRGSALMNEKVFSSSPEKALRAYDQVQAETRHFNEELAGGKWKYVMSASPRKRPIFQKPDREKIPATAIAPTTTAAPTEVTYPANAVSLEAERPTRQFAKNGLAWKVVEGLGRTGDSITLLPTSQSPSDADRLEYDFTIPDQAAARLMVYCLPTHAIRPGVKLRYGASVDAGPASTVDVDAPEFSRQWSENVLHNVAIGITKLRLAPGRHTLTIRPLDPGLVFDKIVIDLGV